jgi:hypothetical protein
MEHVMEPIAISLMHVIVELLTHLPPVDENPHMHTPVLLPLVELGDKSPGKPLRLGIPFWR